MDRKQIRREQHFRLAALLIIVLAAALRVQFLGNTSEAPLWLDEFFSVQWSNGYSPRVDSATHVLPVNKVITSPPSVRTLEDAQSVPAIWSSLRSDVQGPAYYTLLRLWRMVFGTGDLTMQLLSGLVSVGGVAVLMFALRPVTGMGTALWSGLIMAAAPTQLVYCREIRPYAMVTFFVLLTFWAVVMIRQRGSRPWLLVLAGVGFLFSMLTHYYCAPALAAIFVWGMFWLPRRERTRLALAAGAAAVLFLLLWGPSLLAQWQFSKASGNTNWMRTELGGPLFTTLARLPGALPRLFVDFSSMVEGYGYWLPLVVAAAGFAIVATARLLWRRDLWLFWAWLWAVVLAVAALDLWMNTSQLELTRMLLVAGPALYVLVAGMVSRDPRKWWSHAIPLAVVVGCVWADQVGVSDARVASRLRYPLVAQVLRQGASSDTPVVLFGAGQQWRPEYVYLGVRYYLEHAPANIVLLDARPASAEAMAFLRQHQSIWSVQVFEVPGAKLKLPGFSVAESYFVPDTGVVSHHVRNDTIPVGGLPTHTYVVMPGGIVDLAKAK